MPKMTKYQLEHFKDKVERNLDPLIDDQELLVKQFTTEATDKASKKLAIKIGAQKIIERRNIYAKNDKIPIRA